MSSAIIAAGECGDIGHLKMGGLAGARGLKNEMAANDGVSHTIEGELTPK